MARKSSKLSDFIALVEVQAEVARDVYWAQSDKTQNVIDKIAALIQKQMTGELKGGYPIPEDTQMKFASVLAVEVIKDLAFTGIQIANFEFPAKMCAGCGDPMPAKRREKTHA